MPLRRLRLTRRPSWKAAAVAAAAAVGVLQFAPRLPDALADANAAVERQPLPFFAHVGDEAFGRSGQVRLETAMPGGALEVPLLVGGQPGALEYYWVRASDSLPYSPPRPLTGASVAAPEAPGFFRLALARDGAQQIIEDLTLAVMVPYGYKQGGELNGYTLGRWAGEGRSGRGEAPAGFLEVTEADLALPVSQHVRIGDLLPHDGQRQWPRYAAVEQRLLDKLELVVAQLQQQAAPGRTVSVDVNAGFRSPSYNRKVAGSASTSRHMHGDAIDVAIDADGDGRVTRRDIPLVTKAVEAVERAHPDLVGGLGLYTKGHWRRPFVHIDTRGKRARWTA